MTSKPENPPAAQPSQKAEAEKPTKKEYRSPSLVVYGDVHEITQDTRVGPTMDALTGVTGE